MDRSSVPSSSSSVALEPPVVNGNPPIVSSSGSLSKSSEYSSLMSCSLPSGVRSLSTSTPPPLWVGVMSKAVGTAPTSASRRKLDTPVNFCVPRELTAGTGADPRAGAGAAVVPSRENPIRGVVSICLPAGASFFDEECLAEARSDIKRGSLAMQAPGISLASSSRPGNSPPSMPASGTSTLSVNPSSKCSKNSRTRLRTSRPSVVSANSVNRALVRAGSRCGLFLMVYPCSLRSWKTAARTSAWSFGRIPFFTRLCATLSLISARLMAANWLRGSRCCCLQTVVVMTWVRMWTALQAFQLLQVSELDVSVKVIVRHPLCEVR
eukprot:m.408486 g.408486  ORF g.408486 m.408486 type:complete len:323 (-) comp28451_c0_seq4:38-1006(-)